MINILTGLLGALLAADQPAAVSNLVEAISDGMRNASVKQLLDQLEVKCETLRVQIGTPPPNEPTFPVNLALIYRQRVAKLERAIAEKRTPAVLEAARALIERVIVQPPADDDGRHPIELEGAIEGMLRAGGMIRRAAMIQQDTREPPTSGLDLFTCSVKKAQGAEPRSCLQ